ncbi:MAG: FIST N-terminal domain-containing protein [Rhodopila sp.]
MGYVMPIRPRRRPLRPCGEIHAGLTQANLELVVLFCSRSFNLDILGPEIGRLFENVTVVGCTTADEITPIGYLEGSITGFSLSAGECQAVAQFIPVVSLLQIPQGAAAAGALIRRLADRGGTAEVSDMFALLLIDGMCTTEELVLSSIHRRLDPS